MRKRTKASYARLFDSPTDLFAGVETILFPNNQGEIWIRDTKGSGLSFSIKVSRGPYGIGVQIDSHAGCEPIAVMSDSGSHVELCQYDNTADARRYRDAYRAGGETFSKVAAELSAKRSENQ
jgi:hypothetical protein